MLRCFVFYSKGSFFEYVHKFSEKLTINSLYAYMRHGDH